MLAKHIAIDALVAEIEADTATTRFVARVFFTNNINTYFTLIDILSGKADIVIRLSDDLFCKGEDTVLDIKLLINYLDEHKDSTILIPHLAEYLRIGEVTERNVAGIYSLLNRHVHSDKRVWIPIFSAQGLFQSIIGELDKERLGNSLFEISETPSDFSATAYSKPFAMQPNLVDADGLKSWLRLWDDRKIRSGMSFATRHIKQISPSNGYYTLSIIADSFSYISNSLKESNTKLVETLGSAEQWAFLIPYVAASNGTIEHLITNGLNVVKFNPNQILKSWTTLDPCRKWLFCLWYTLGLSKQYDYISYAMTGINTESKVIRAIECSIITCTENPNFNEWLNQRKLALTLLGITQLSAEFWTKYDELSDTHIKIRLLTGITHEERVKIIELISQALSDGKNIDDYRTILEDNYPDLLLYLSEPMHMQPELADYLYRYKINKIANRFDLSLSNMAGDFNASEYRTRGQILYSLKNAGDTFFIWIDGMGIEWIDMLLEKVESTNPLLSNPAVDIGTAVLPTISSVNMDKADPDTISEKKFDALDSLSHIKDKNNCNYTSIIANQFEMIDRIAALICHAAKKNPDKSIVVTADHGMSRMAALGFHQTQGIDAPPSAIVQNHGRYCQIPDKINIPSITNTVKNDDIIAYKTHNHFAISGYAPGEIHGGATPEEILVPIICFRPSGRRHDTKNKATTYRLISPDVYLDNNGNAPLLIETQGPVQNLTIEINGNQLMADKVGKNKWSVLIPGLVLDRHYSVYFYLNNTYSTNSETICVKRKGLNIDDDL